LFAVRCAAAAALAYLAARAIGLPHPLWAPISALVVSREGHSQTRQAILFRIAGTALGVVIAIVVGLLTARFALAIPAKIAVVVAIGAACAYHRPALRVCVWTAPIVLLTTVPGESITRTGCYRGTEVLIGVLIGGALHWLADAPRRARRARRKREAPTAPAGTP
jgi:uncharacterized membrane protein YgaE (UPF0421/DUF939 family)